VVLKSIFALTAVVIIFTAAKLSGYPAAKLGLIMLASLSFLASPFTLYGAAFPATLQLQYPAILEFTGRTLSLLFVVLAVLAKSSLAGLILAQLAYIACQTCLMIILSRRFFRPSFQIDYLIWKKLLLAAWPVALNNLLVSLILRIDQVMLGQMRPDGNLQLGLYSVSVKYCEVFNLIPAIFFSSLFPLLSRYSDTTGEETFRRLYTLSFKYLSLLIMPIALFSTLHAEAILSFLFGQAYAASALSMQILIWSEVFVFMALAFFNAVVSSGHQRLQLPLTITTATANIALNAWLIPAHGAPGAALATLISCSLALPACFLFPRLRPLATAFIKNSFRPAAGILLIGLMLAPCHLGVFASGAVLTISFIGLMVLCGALDKTDRALFRHIFSSNNDS